MVDDIQLIKLYQQGDENAFEKLVLKYRPCILSKISEQALVYFNGLDYDDLYQECVIVLYRAVNSYHFDTSASFYTYYMQSLKNLFNQLYRKYATHKRKAFWYDDDNKYAEIIENYAGDNYASSLSPETVCVLKESFEKAYQILNNHEKDILSETIVNINRLTVSDKRVYYKCKSKIKKSLQSTCQ